MTVSFEIPAAMEQNLRRHFADLNQAAKEAGLVELYRQDKITHFELSQALALDRFETDALLKRHNVTEDLLTSDEYEAARKHLHGARNR